MPKSKIFQKEDTNLVLYSRKDLKTILFNQYYNLFMNSYEFSGDIDYQQKEYILKRLWEEGSIACFKLAGSEGSTSHPNGLAVFVPFVPGWYNIYDYPTKVSLINTKGVRFIPTGLQEVDKDVVIGYIQRNHKSVKLFVEHYINRIVDVLMVIKTNLKAHKMPWLIVSTPEDQAKLKALFESLKNDEPELYVDTDSADKFKSLVSGAPYIIDKLYAYAQCLENQLREYLGFGNIGVAEKKEHLITDEVQANNAVIDSNKECLLDPLKEFFERVRDVLGISIDVNMKTSESYSFEDEDTEEEEEVQENE